MKRNWITLLILIVILAVAALFANISSKKQYVIDQNAAPEATIKATFACEDGKWINSVFYPNSDTHVDLALSDGRSLSLPHVISGSGARYANEDESVVFWNKGDTAFITEKGTTTFTNCVDTKAQNNTTPSGNQATEVTIGGTYVCLPHRDTSGPTTLECAFGLKADNGSYYALSTSTFPNINTGDQVIVKGTAIPVDKIDARTWQIYNIVGSIKVTSINKV